MAVTRHGAGLTATLRALASQVHPVFMLPPIAAAAFGGVLAGGFDPVPGGLHLAAVFLAVYTAHLKDGYVDFHGRGEDDDHPMTALGCRLALGGTTVAFALCLAGLWLVATPVAVALTAPCWAIGYLHAPYLDMRPVTATMGYPAGIALALLGGVAVQGGPLGPAATGFAAVFLILLSGVKVIDDATDVAYDRSIDKRTVAVVLGPQRARRLAYGLIAIALIATVVLAVGGVFPPSSVVAPVAFAVVAAMTRRAGPELATMLLVRGAYVFLALLVAAIWFRPFEGLPLPDITVLGPYTYLATEVIFGGLAAVLLWHANAWWPAARTILVLYPVAYVWDWYTLAVGVFAIPLRTGVELVGIPLEEHLFMVVVPALVIGVHETLRAWDEDRDLHPGPPRS